MAKTSNLTNSFSIEKRLNYNYKVLQNNT